MKLYSYMTAMVPGTIVRLIGTDYELTYMAGTSDFKKAKEKIASVSVEEISVDRGVLCLSINDYLRKADMEYLYMTCPGMGRKQYWRPEDADKRKAAALAARAAKLNATSAPT